MVMTIQKSQFSGSAGDRRALLALGRGKHDARPAVDTLLQIAETATRRYAATALAFQGETLRYDELMRGVGQLAAELMERGVKRESRVAICVPRGFDEPVSMLATWAVGGAYVPLDPSHPAERSALILEDARPDVIITHAKLARMLRIPEGCDVLLLDEERTRVAQRIPLAQFVAPTPEQLAYVLFTSGSTGRPKGVAISRGAFANFVRSMAHTPGMGENERLLSITTTTFDIAGLELFLPLYVGAQVIIADRETQLDAHKLRAVIESEQITMFQATPTTYRLLLEAGFGREGTQLRMLCGGEALSRELACALTETGGELWNMYGPTETTVYSTLWHVPRAAHTISIGRPIDNTQLYVLDEQLKLLPRGEIGELCIGGVGLSRGYFGRDELTRQRFVPNPHVEGDLIYHTGDLARWLPNGEIECLGRIDHQVKIRGFRIELGEIESCLRAVPGVRDVVVVARCDARDEPQLAAYFVGDADVDALRMRARAALPVYMLPAFYTRLAELPLNTNGKVDRKLLPEPQAEEAQPSTQDRGPRSEQEQRMARLFADVLGVAEPPIDRDLFLLGGTSLQLMELRRRIHESFGVELPLVTLLDTPTIERLVQALEQGGSASEPAVVRLAEGQPGVPPLLCLMGVSLYRDLARNLGNERAVYGIHVPYSVHPHQPAPRLEDLAALYVEVILARFSEQPYQLAGLCFGGVLAFEVARQLRSRGYQVGSVAVLDAALPGAEHYSPREHARAILNGVIHTPLSTCTAVWNSLAQRLRSKKSPAGTAQASAQEFDVESPLAQTMLREYERTLAPLDVPLLVCRARDREQAVWRHTDGDMGFLEASPRLIIAGVPGSHLEILQEPAVAHTAAAVRDTLAVSETQRYQAAE